VVGNCKPIANSGFKRAKVQRLSTKHDSNDLSPGSMDSFGKATRAVLTTSRRIEPGLTTGSNIEFASGKTLYDECPVRSSTFQS
jgi:hypothetical protein